jgi:hypothetical protein
MYVLPSSHPPEREREKERERESISLSHIGAYIISPLSEENFI